MQLPRALENLFGKEFELPVGDTWLAHPNGGIRVVAAAAYARSPHGKESLSELIRLLNDPNAYYRTRSLQVVQRIMGRKFSKDEYYVAAPLQQRRLQVERLLKRYSR